MLAIEYLMLPDNARIENYNENIQLFRISTKTNHPQAGYAVFISRRSLKHFVEERKRELLKNHSKLETIEKIYFAIDHMYEVISDFDSYEFVIPRHLYTKDYYHLDQTELRIVADEINESLEICSIHFRGKK